MDHRVRDAGPGGGWPALGDLGHFERNKEHKDRLRELMEQHYPRPSAPQVVSSETNQLFHFITVARERDIVLAMQGQTVRGIGRVMGPYFYKAGDGRFVHRRPVEWLHTEDWRQPVVEGLRRTFHRLHRRPVNLIEAEVRMLGLQRPVEPAARPKPELSPLTGVVARIDAILRRKRQVILYGPPGTGKTYWAQRSVEELAARSWFGKASSGLTEAERETLQTERGWEVCAFHPSYGYEDFLEGYRPREVSGSLVFELRDGVFKRLCERAAAHPKRQFFIVIDEINRGDIPKIFGELLTVLEKDKRGRSITLPVSGTAFAVPDNVYAVGTMNTADRSIALLDAALRRRFGFIEMLPDSSVLAAASVADIPLGPWLDELNRRIVQHVGRDGRDLQVGHSYLMPGGSPVKDLGRFVELLRDDIIPLLAEYCYEDFDTLDKILGSTVVLSKEQRVNTKLFEPGRHEDLAQALLAEFESIVAIPQAVGAVEESETEADDEASEAADDDDGAEEDADISRIEDTPPAVASE